MALDFLDMKFEHVQLCSYPGLPLCIGCCGHDFTTQEEICRDIRSNTVALDNTENLHSFRNRHGKDVRQSGICPCVVRKNGVAQCAIHPLILKTQDDMRDGFCNIMFECRTAWEFKSWPQEIKKKFMKFASSYEQIPYSLGIYSGTLLKRFEHEILQKDCER